MLNLQRPTKNRKMYIRKKLRQFIQFLESEFSLILHGHYVNLGIKLGLVFGVSLGIFFFNESGGTPIGLCIGMFIGYLIGNYMDNKAVLQNKVLIIV